MYVVRPADEPLHQGDIISDIPVVFVPESGLNIVYEQHSEAYPRPATIHKASEVPDAFGEGLERIIAHAYKSRVMILSQTCDIEHRDLIAIAPLFPLSSVTSADRRRSITEYKVNHRFYLPQYSDIIDDSYVDFVIINTVKRDLIPMEKRILSLDEHGRSIGLYGVRFHDLRHTHATLMLCQGIHPKIVSERLGHSSIAITLDTYSHVMPGL